MTAIDPLEGLGAEFVIRSAEARPELCVEAGDLLLVRDAQEAAVGVLVIAARGDAKAALCRWEGQEGLQVRGVVVGLVRRFSDER